MPREVNQAQSKRRAQYGPRCLYLARASFTSRSCTKLSTATNFRDELPWRK
jgi:hypothetical protein